VDLHPTTLFRVGAIVHRDGRVSKQYVCHPASPSGQPDTDDDHVKRDGDDGRNLLASNVDSAGLSSSASEAVPMDSPCLELRIDHWIQ